MKSVLVLSRYFHNGASSRLRIEQYFPSLKEGCFDVNNKPLFPENYVDSLYKGQRDWKSILNGYFSRSVCLRASRSYDLLWIEKELFPFLPWAVERAIGSPGRPYVVDYDDATFHRYDCHPQWIIRKLLGGKIDRVMKHAALVVAGNEYLAQRARDAGARKVAVVPTVVDLERYQVARKAAAPEAGGVVTVGWIGSPATVQYLELILPALETVALQCQVRLVAVGAAPPVSDKVDTEFWPWSEDSEVSSIQSFDIGIMPLPDEPWERGKCGYKLIQYMACGLPVVASPVGVNKEIVSPGENGFLAESMDEWAEALTRLIEDTALRASFGRAGRQRVEAWYSLQVQAPRLASLLREAAS